MNWRRCSGSCTIVCEAAQAKQKVTGGGWIRSNGARASFGFVVYRKEDGAEVKGRSTYQNHATNESIYSTRFLTLDTSGEWAQFRGACSRVATPTNSPSARLRDKRRAPGSEAGIFRSIQVDKDEAVMRPIKVAIVAAVVLLLGSGGLVAQTKATLRFLVIQRSNTVNGEPKVQKATTVYKRVE